MKIGDMVQRKSVKAAKRWDGDRRGSRDESRKAVPLWGRVVWIHPQGRYHVVEFETDNGHLFRECFHGVGERDYVPG